MTTDEMKRQRANVLLEYQESEQKLEHLRVKAQSMGELLTALGRWVSGSPEISIYRADQAHFGLNVQLTAPKYIAALDLNPAHFERRCGMSSTPMPCLHSRKWGLAASSH